MDRMAIRQLLVPTDFSDHADAAIRYAEFIAARFGAHLTLLHAMELHPSADPLPLGMVSAPGYEESERFALQALENCRATQMTGVVDSSTRVVFARSADAILEVSRSSASDTIVMGTRGRGRIAAALLGSVAEEVIRESDRPVLTVRRSESAGASRRIERILCPVNYTAAAAKALAHAMFFASAFDAELLALNFQEHAPSSDDEIEAELERLRLWVGDVPLSVRVTCIAHHGDPVAQVSEFARSHGIDLVVLGSQQKRGGTATTIGSTTDKLTRHAPCPVLTVPAGTVMIAEERGREEVALLDPAS